MNIGLLRFAENETSPLLKNSTRKKKKGWKNRIGQRGECLAVQHLFNKGYYIWHRNWQIKSGEIDIIAIQKRTLAFIEVKTRLTKYASDYDPFDAVDDIKMKHLQKVAKNFLEIEAPQIKRRRIKSFRFDIIGVTLTPTFHKIWLRKNSVIHYIDAFQWEE